MKRPKGSSSGLKIVDSNLTNANIYGVCRDCAEAAIKLEINRGKRFFSVMTMHEGVCDICKKIKLVTEPRDYGYLKYRVPANWR